MKHPNRDYAIPVLLAALLAGCGGGSSSIPNAAAPRLVSPSPSSGPLTGQSNPNVDPSDDAADWRSSRYDLSGSGDNALQTAITESNVASLAPSWIFNGTVGTLSSVAVSGGVVYRTETGSNVYAVDESTGSQIWKWSPVAGEGFVASPLVAGGLLYLGSVTGDFYVLDQYTGEQAFTYPPQSAWGPLINGTQLRAHYRGSPVYFNGAVYTGASNHVEPADCMQGGQVLDLDPISPQTNAIATFTPSGTSGVGVWSSPVFDASGDMFVATGNSCSYTDAPYGDSIVRLDPTTLSVDWSSQGPPDAHDLDFGTTPVVVDNEVIDGGKDGYVYAYQASTGQPLWKQSPWPANGVVLGALATDGRYVVVPYALSTDGQHAGIAVYDVNGDLIWSTVTGVDPSQNKGILSAPAISGGMLFIGYTKASCTSNCDGIGAFDLATGTPLWFYSTPTPIFGGIVVVQGGVFAEEEGNPTLYCFQPQNKGSIRRPRIIYGTRGRAGAFHDPWLHAGRSFDGDNAGSWY